jgi:hypothetical protein
MNTFQHDKTHHDSPGKRGIPLRLDRLRVRLGASHRQFMVLGLLVLTGGVMMARPAGMLLWHRLRIISGMPRTAIADQDPQIIAASTGTMLEPVSDGRSIQLDVALLRDPFDTPMFLPVQVVMNVSSDLHADSKALPLASPEHGRLLDALSSIRLKGTAKGLGTALVDGSVRSIGARFDVSDYTVQLIAVNSGSIELQVIENHLFEGLCCIVDREGAIVRPPE